MSRSYRKSPYTAVTAARSDKAYKRIEHRRERAAVRNGLSADAEATRLPRAKAFGDPWRGEKDSKSWLAPGNARTRGMRK